MRVAFVGDVGAGKSTLAALLARSLLFEGRRVIAVDAGRGRRLHRMLALEPRGRDRDRNPGDHDLDAIPVIAVRESGRESEEADPSSSSSAGPSLEEILDALPRDPQTTILCELAGGPGAFSNDLLVRLDLVLVVVEPAETAEPERSPLDRHWSAEELPGSSRVRVVGSKVEGDHHVAQLIAHAGERLLTTVSRSSSIAGQDGCAPDPFELEEGNRDALALVEKEIARVAELRCRSVRARSSDARSGSTTERELEAALADLDRIYLAGSASTE